MKKSSFIISAAIIIILMISGMAQALQISAENVTGKPGDSVVVPINISSLITGLDVDAFSFIIRYNPDILTFDETSGTDKTGTLTETLSFVSGKIIAPGEVKINGALFGNPVHIISSGLFLKISFIDAAPGVSDLILSGFTDDINGAATVNATATISPAETLDAPSGLEAKSGIDSVRLSWSPNTSAYLTGYNIYRSVSVNTGYAKINDDLITGDFYTDNDPLTKGTAYYYYITALDSLGKESPHSNTVSVLFGTVKMFIPDAKGSAGNQIKLPVSIANADNLQMCAVEMYINYDPSVLSAKDVEKTALTADYGWSKNVVGPGVVRIALATGTEGATLYGEGSLFYIIFDVVGEIGDTTDLTFEINNTAIWDCRDELSETGISLDLSDAGVFTVDDCGFLGDIVEDCAVNDNDAQMVLDITVGLVTFEEKYLKAGDVNKDLRIRANDAALIKRIAKGLPLAPTSSAARERKDSSPVTVSIPTGTAIAWGADTWVTIRVDNMSDIRGADIILNYDKSLVKVTEVRTTQITQNFDMKFHDDSTGQLKIALGAKTGDQTLSGSGNLVEVRFSVVSANAKNRVTPLPLVSVHLNDTYSRDFMISALQTDVKTNNGTLRISGYDAGDINHSRAVDLTDAILGLKVLAGIKGDTVYTDVDVNGDGKISMDEIIYVIQRVAWL